MSYIDSYKHEIIGLFAGLVVKKPTSAVAEFIIRIVEVEDYPALNKVINEIGFREQIFEFCG